MCTTMDDCFTLVRQNLTGEGKLHGGSSLRKNRRRREGNGMGGALVGVEADLSRRKSEEEEKHLGDSEPS